MTDPKATPSDAVSLLAENAELRIRLQELEDTLHAIHSGDVDALVVNNAIYTLESAHAATDKLRQDVLGQMEDAVFAFDGQERVMFVNAAAERRYGIVSADVLGRPMAAIFAQPLGLQPAPAETPLLDISAPVAVHRVSDGSLIDVETVVSPLLGPLGQRFGSLAVIRDVTQRRRAEMRQAALAQLTEILRDVDDPAVVAFEAARVLGETLRVSRAGYGTFDTRGEILTVDRDWTAPGVETVAGTVMLRDYGTFIESLLRGEAVVVSDVRDEPTRFFAPVLEARSVRSFLNVPIIEQGRLAAILFVNDASPRAWTSDEQAFIRELAERTRSMAERARSARALMLSEQRLREANENLEAAVAARTRELMASEAALRQAQKMEAVGQLTGGIAHDFNNLLGGVSASLQVLQARFRQGKLDQVDRYIGMGQDSVKRAAALTQRLLAFARRQTLDPKPTDLNRLIFGLEDLLRRTVGPDIHVEMVGAGGLWAARIDPSQMENSLLNLCINARDAMLPQGGRLTVETANKWLDERTAATYSLPAGQYVSLCVTDTGCGMPPDVIEHIFDPFFTTKPTGQGTGLGLSMVYGFVRQSGGQVRVYSEVGKGTTMCLYLPRYFGPAPQDDPSRNPPELEQGEGERVLVIEDEETIRLLLVEVLKDAGYQVVSAGDGPSGLRALQGMQRLDLLVTDVGLPGGLNGRQVADAARQIRPGLKVLFITGYAQNAAVGNGLLEPGMEILTKPFEISSFAAKVRTMTSADRLP